MGGSVGGWVCMWVTDGWVTDGCVCGCGWLFVHGCVWVSECVNGCVGRYVYVCESASMHYLCMHVCAMDLLSTNEWSCKFATSQSIFITYDHLVIVVYRG